MSGSLFPWAAAAVRHRSRGATARRSVVGGFLGGVATAMDEHGALEAHHFLAALVDATSGDCDDPLRRPALRLALGEDSALGIEGVASEHWVGGFDLVPAEIGDD